MVYTTKAGEAIPHLRPHYSNQYFATARTVYLAEGYKAKSDGRNDYAKGAEYNYSDRLWQWDYDKAKKSWEIAKARGLVANSAAEIEAYLTAYYDRQLKLVHVLAGFNVSNGYDYQVYGVIFEKDESPQEQG